MKWLVEERQCIVESEGGDGMEHLGRRVGVGVEVGVGDGVRGGARVGTEWG